jgi:hypothetical protein
MQGSNPISKLSTHPWKIILIVSLIISIAQTFYLRNATGLSLFSGAFGVFLNLIIITAVIGYPVKWIFKSNRGFWVGFALAIAYNVFIISLIAKH